MVAQIPVHLPDFSEFKSIQTWRWLFLQRKVTPFKELPINIDNCGLFDLGHKEWKELDDQLSPTSIITSTKCYWAFIHYYCLLTSGPQPREDSVGSAPNSCHLVPSLLQLVSGLSACMCYQTPETHPEYISLAAFQSIQVCQHLIAHPTVLLQSVAVQTQFKLLALAYHIGNGWGPSCINGMV